MLAWHVVFQILHNIHSSIPFQFMIHSTPARYVEPYHNITTGMRRKCIPGIRLASLFPSCLCVFVYVCGCARPLPSPSPARSEMRALLLAAAIFAVVRLSAGQGKVRHSIAIVRAVPLVSSSQDFANGRVPDPLVYMVTTYPRLD